MQTLPPVDIINLPGITRVCVAWMDDGAAADDRPPKLIESGGSSSAAPSSPQRAGSTRKRRAPAKWAEGPLSATGNSGGGSTRRLEAPPSALPSVAPPTAPASSHDGSAAQKKQNAEHSGGAGGGGDDGHMLRRSVSAASTGVSGSALLRTATLAGTGPEAPSALHGEDSGVDTSQEETLRKLGFLGVEQATAGEGLAAGRAREWAAIRGEFNQVTLDAAAATLDQPSFARAVEQRYWHPGINTRLTAGLFRAFDWDGTGTLNLHEYVLFHAAVVRYNHQRDRDSVELHTLRMRAVVACFDSDGDGGLQDSELSGLVREMASGDGHVEHLLRRFVPHGLEHPAAAPVLMVALQAALLSEHLSADDLLPLGGAGQPPPPPLQQSSPDVAVSAGHRIALRDAAGATARQVLVRLGLLGQNAPRAAEAASAVDDFLAEAAAAGSPCSLILACPEVSGQPPASNDHSEPNGWRVVLRQGSAALSGGCVGLDRGG